jgi:hypothetical protein
MVSERIVCAEMFEVRVKRRGLVDCIYAMVNSESAILVNEHGGLRIDLD